MGEWRGCFGLDSDDEGIKEEGENSILEPSFRDSLIVLLDCREEMFQLNTAGQSLLQLGLRSAKNILKKKALASERDLVGVILFGTEKSANNDLKQVFVLQRLEQSGAERVQQLSKLLKMNRDQLVNTIGKPSEGVSLTDAIWACQNEFSACKLRLGFRRLFLITNDDSPHEGNQHMRMQLRAKIEDLQQTDITLVLFPLRPNAKGNPYFDPKCFFYDHLLAEDERAISGYDLINDLLQKVEEKASTRRPQVRLEFELAPGLTLAVGVYNLSRRCAIPSAERLLRSTNERVKHTTRKFLADTAEVVMPTDLKKAVVVADKKILFEDEESKQMQRLFNTGIKLIAFYPLRSLKNHYHVKPASFVYPDESIIKGSTRLFSSLLRACLEKNSFALCSFTARSNSSTQLSALVPQAEQRDQSGVQTVPPGFHLVQLPYADDFRKLNLRAEIEPNTKEIEVSKALTQRIVIPHWSPDNHGNPALQKYHSYLEALALDKGEPKFMTDTTKLEKNALDRAAKAISEFNKTCGITAHAAESEGRKRKQGVNEGDSKRQCRENNQIDFGAEARSDRLEKLTMPILKEAIKKLNLHPTGTKKQDLINAIKAHFCT